MATKRKQHKKACPLPTVNLNKLPDSGFLRLRQVLAVFPVSRSTWLEGVKSGRYPKQVKLGPRAVAWRIEDIRRLIANGVVA